LPVNDLRQLRTRKVTLSNQVTAVTFGRQLSVEFGQSASHDYELYLEAAENRPNWFR
jgi:hypothetical protein